MDLHSDTVLLGLGNPNLEFIRSVSILMALLALASVTPMILRGLSLGKRKESLKCTLCGNCCRFRIIALDGRDIKRIEEAGHRGFVKKSGSSMKMDNGKCFFLKDDKCSIYDIRPQVCRDFPFSKVFGMDFAKAGLYCPMLCPEED